MPGRPGTKPPSLLLCLLFLPLLLGWGEELAAREVRRSMPHLRALLMGDAQVATADDPAVLFYNPAGMAGVNATAVEIFIPQLAFNKLANIALSNQNRFESELDRINEDIKAEKYESLLGHDLFSALQLRAPVVVLPDPGLAIVLGAEALVNLQITRTSVVPLMRIETFADVVLAASKFSKINDDLWIGGTLKAINRRGLDRTYTIGELVILADGAASLQNRPEFKDARRGFGFTQPGLDVGTVWWLPFGRSWAPRLAFSAINIGGIDGNRLTGMAFGPRENDYDPPQAGELPLLSTLGFAVSPSWRGARFTLAVDVVDVSRDVLPGDDYQQRLRLGAEVGLFPHDTGAARLALLAGWNQGHPSYGMLARVWVFELGFGIYTVELGADPGDNPKQRTVFNLGFRF